MDHESLSARQMKTRTITVAIVAFFLGFIAHLISAHFIPRAIDEDAEIARHWKRVNDYSAYMNDPTSYNSELFSGFYGAEIPYDPMPSLSALSAVGELEHIDVVLPLVPYNQETSRHLIQFVTERPDSILYLIGNPEWVDYAPSGEAPMHFALWFKPGAKSAVQQLIKDLEALAASNE